jgi:hypothetical protein
MIVTGMTSAPTIHARRHRLRWSGVVADARAHRGDALGGSFVRSRRTRSVLVA